MRGIPIDTHIYKYKGVYYPNYIKYGAAYKYIEPVALQFCKGNGLDIGGESGAHLRGARPINLTLADEYNAHNLPAGKYNYIFSSHTLEHISDYVDTLQYWKSYLKPRGVLFLYLPSHEMEYWLPQNNKKHLHVFTPDGIEKILYDLGFEYVLKSDRDMYWSFSVVGMLK
jgi:SAM-dependent methyltransferase